MQQAEAGQLPETPDDHASIAALNQQPLAVDPTAEVVDEENTIDDSPAVNEIVQAVADTEDDILTIAQITAETIDPNIGMADLTPYDFMSDEIML